MKTVPKPPRCYLWLTVLSAILLTALLGSCSNGTAEDTKETTSADKDKVTVLVRFKPEADREAIHRQVGAEVERNYSSVEGLQAVVLKPGVGLEEALEIYNNHPDVRYAEPDHTVTTQPGKE